MQSLPKLYHQFSKKRKIPAKETRDYERATNSFAKLHLAIQYFKDCEFFGIVPKFGRAETPNLKDYYAIHSDIHTTDIQKQVSLLSIRLHTKRILPHTQKFKKHRNL